MSHSSPLPLMRWTQNPFFKYGLVIASGVLLVLLSFPGFVSGLFRADQFMPHATCYLRNPQIIFLHVASDLLIGFAYVSISCTLGYLVFRASRDIPFHWMFLAFGLFIITCGFTHFMEVWTVWRAVYWLAGYVKLICAVASVATAIALFPLVPKVFALIDAVKVSEERRLNLEKANQELEAFAYSVSHDLRAPLRAVQGMAGAFTEDYGPHLETGAKEYLERISAASQRMETLIQDLLEYSRVSRVECELTPVDVQAALGDARAALDHEIRSRGAELQVQGPFPAVQANPTLLAQVLTNLLGNAIKFVAPGVQPRVEISAAVSSRTARIHVKDNGIGIPAGYQEKIFRIFERLHPSSDYPGTGIGLAIVQKAITRMKGRMGLESEPGKGSCFWIELPRA